MESVGTSVVNTSIITQCINPEDQHLNLYCHENLKSQSEVLN